VGLWATRQCPKPGGVLHSSNLVAVAKDMLRFAPNDQWLFQIAEEARFGVCLADHRKTVRYVNYYHLAHVWRNPRILSPQYAVGQPLGQVFPPAFSRQCEDLFDQVLGTGGWASIHERVDLREGAPTTVSVTAVQLGQDVSMEASVLMLSSVLGAGPLSTSASHELQYYATAFSTIIHELRNHLQVIAGGLGILQKHAPGEEGMVKRALEHITSGVVQSRRFLTKSAELVQPLSRRIVLNREIVDLNEFLSYTIELLKASVTSIPQPVRVKLELGLGLPPVSICTSSIHRVLEHLLQNAVEAMPGGGDVTISTEYVKESGFPFVRVEVVDTGQGMDGEACRLALQPFYTTKPNYQGLGLPFSRKTMRDHGGNLTVESTPMGGTRVRLIFRDLPGSAGASQETQELAEAGLTVNPDRMSQ